VGLAELGRLKNLMTSSEVEPTILLYYKYFISGHNPFSYFCLNSVLFLFKTHNVSETGFCLHLQVKSIQLGPIDKASC
jgi:hypothetical protein